MALHMLSMAINGYQWLSMAINGYQWLSMAINGYQWLSMAINGYQWHQVLSTTRRSTDLTCAVRPQASSAAQLQQDIVPPGELPSSYHIIMWYLGHTHTHGDRWIDYGWMDK